jgi:hypothetical protein
MDAKEIIPDGKFSAQQLVLLKLFLVNIPTSDWESIKTYVEEYFYKNGLDKKNNS